MMKMLPEGLTTEGDVAQEKKKGNSGVVTSTPPVGGGDKTKATAAEGARSRLSFN